MKKYKVTGMSCAACSSRVERVVSSLPGVSACSVNLLLGQMELLGEIDDASVIAAVSKAGYAATPLAGEKEMKRKESLETAEQKPLLWRLIFSLGFLLALMYLSMGHTMLSLPLPRALSENPLAIALLQLLLSAVVLIINQKFFISGTKGLLHRAPNMDTLVALGSLSAFLYSTVVLFLMLFRAMAGDHAGVHGYLHELYFESAAMIPALITLGKLLEAISKGKTKSSLLGLMELAPQTARVLIDEKEVEIPAEELKVGDIFAVKPGESFPADGIIISGHTSVDESALTGESLPIDKQIGDRITTATVNKAGYVLCRAERVGEDTALFSIIKTVSEASAGKAPIAKAADRVAGIFVPTVLLLALLTTVLWLLLGREIGFALARGISVLVISCPCALGLATPVAVMVGSGRGARQGILFKNAAAMEEVGKVGVVALDKTGTVTNGTPVVTDILPVGDLSEEALLELAYALESKSEHPLAKAVCQRAEERGLTAQKVEDFEASPGFGLSAKLKGEALLGGKLSYIAEFAEIDDRARAAADALASDGKTPLFFAYGKKTVGMIAVADSLKAGSREAVEALHGMGIKTVLLTGDNHKVAESIAKEAGIDTVIAELLPNEKAAAVEELKKQGKVAMVGDGINDAPALTAADIGIAIGAGTDIAIDAADIVLMKSHPLDIAAAICLGKATLRIIHENLFWAFCYNIIGIPLAAGAFISLLGWQMNPMFGAAAMSISSFLVVMNALRLNSVKLYKISHKENKEMKKTIRIEGMMCPHCEARVKTLLEGVEGVTAAEVSFKDGTARLSLEKQLENEALRQLIEAEGYRVTGIE